MPTLTKKYLCVICKKEEIVESIVEHIMEGEVPDISNCDFSTYSDHKITNGKLLIKKPRIYWITSYRLHDKESARSKTPGGVCNNCLNKKAVKPLLEHINFVDEKNLKNSKWD